MMILLIVLFAIYYISTVRLKLCLCFINIISPIYMQEISEDLLEEVQTFRDILAYTSNPLQNPDSQCTMRFMPGEIRVIEQGRVKHLIVFEHFVGYNMKIEDEGRSLYKFKMNSYVRFSKTCNKKPERRIVHDTFWFYLNSKELEEMEVELIRAATNRIVQNSKEKLKFLIFLNPHAGANSGQHYEAVEKFIRYTNFTFELIETTHRGHCKEHLDQLDLSPYQAVVIISGDGLMHQFANSRACGKIPVTHVPGGSGNAFSKAQTTEAGEECKDEEAMFLAVKGRVTSMNLVLMQLQKEPEPIYSFLSLQWAFLADVDMNSEFLRCCGGLRFEIYAIYRMIALNRYPARLTYSTSETSLPPLSEQINNPAFQSIETSFLNAIFLSIPFVSDKYEWGPLLKVEDEAIDMQLVTEDHGRWQLIKYLMSSDTGDHFDKEKKAPKEGFQFQHKKLKSYRLEPLGEGQNIGIFGIDGERYEAQRMQASISDKKILTFT